MQIPKLPQFRLPFKPPPGLLTWTVSGIVVDNLGRGVTGILIQVKDKATNGKAAQMYTGADGRFSVNLFPEDLGYRVTPFMQGYSFCPGYQDVFGNADLRFNCIK